MIKDNRVATGGVKRGARLVVVNADKGGAGKSFTGRTIAWKLSELGLPIAAFDGDARNAHLDRFHAGSFAVTRCNLREEDGWSLLYDQLADIDPAAYVLVDLPAGAGDCIHTELPRLRMALEEDGSDLVHIWVGDSGEDAVRLFRDLYDVAPATSTAFVMNCRGDADDARFGVWRNSKIRARFIEEGGVEAALPDLPSRIADRFALAHAPFGDPGAAALRRSEKLSFRLWSEKVDKQFGPALDLILGRRA